MAISLNNHEDRIKKLEAADESLKLSTELIGTVPNGKTAVILSKSWQTFDVIFILLSAVAEPNYQYGYMFPSDVIKSQINRKKNISISGAWGKENNVQTEFTFSLASNQIKVERFSFTGYDLFIYGLKI